MSENPAEHFNLDYVAPTRAEPMEESVTASEQRPASEARATRDDCSTIPDHDLATASCRSSEIPADLVEPGLVASESTIMHLEGQTNDYCAPQESGCLLDIDKASTLLSSGLLEVIEHEVAATRKIFSDIIKHEEVVLESIQHENAKFSDDAVQNLGTQMAKVRQYIGKLTKIRKDMVHIKEQTESLKRTAAKLVVQHQKRVMDKEEALRQKQSLIKSLAAQPAKPSAPS